MKKLNQDRDKTTSNSVFGKQYNNEEVKVLPSALVLLPFLSTHFLTNPFLPVRFTMDALFLNRFSFFFPYFADQNSSAKPEKSYG